MFDGTEVPPDAVGQHSSKQDRSSAVSREDSAEPTEQMIAKLG